MIFSSIQVTLFGRLAIVTLPLLWHCGRATPGSQTDCAGGSRLVVCRDTQEMYVAAGSAVTSIDMTKSRIKWRSDVGSSERVTDLAVTAEVVAFGTENDAGDAIEGVSRITGRPAWLVRVNKTRDLLAAGPYLIAQTSDREGLVAIDGRTGSIVWRHTRPGFSGYVKLLASSGQTILTDAFSIDGPSGRILQRWPLSNLTSGTFVGDKRIVGNSNGRLLGYREDWSLAWSKQLSMPVEPGTRSTDNSWLGLLAGSSDVVLAAAWVPGQRTTARVFALSSDGDLLCTYDIDNVNFQAPGPVGICNGVALIVTKAADTGFSTVSAFDLRSASIE